MPNATITVAKLYPPKAGKKRSTIVDQNETLWGAMPDLANRMTPGGTYDVNYKEDHFNGKTYLVIEGFKTMAGAPTPAARPPASPTAAPASATKYGSTDDKTAERIYVCGALNSVLQNPKLDPVELTATTVIELTRMFRDAWASTFGHQGAVVSPPTAARPPADPKDGFNDEIPF